MRTIQASSRKIEVLRFILLIAPAAHVVNVIVLLYAMSSPDSWPPMALNVAVICGPIILAAAGIAMIRFEGGLFRQYGYPLLTASLLSLTFFFAGAMKLWWLPGGIDLFLGVLANAGMICLAVASGMAVHK